MIKIRRTCPLVQSGRSLQLAGMFDVETPPHAVLDWSIDGDLESRPWQIGAIVGPSGSGKTSIARELLGDCLVAGYDWPADKCVADGFPDAMPIGDIVDALSAVGFSSPPAWQRPFRVLSNGQQFRVTVARALCDPDRPRVAIDEFTSVVDRQVAQIGSAAVARAVRRVPGRQFVAIACHYDILDWLQPDWVLDLGAPHADSPGCFAIQWRPLQPRPSIHLDIHQADKRAWPIFAPHHYMSGALHKGSASTVGWVGDTPATFCGVLWNPGHTSFWRVHRLVCMPDFQGAGLGMRHLEAVAEAYMVNPKHPGPIHIVTGHPALIKALARSPKWDMTCPPGRKRGRAVGSGLDNSVRQNVGKLQATFVWAPGGVAPPRPSPKAKPRRR